MFHTTLPNVPVCLRGSLVQVMAVLSLMEICKIDGIIMMTFALAEA